MKIIKVCAVALMISFMMPYLAVVEADTRPITIVKSKWAIIPVIFDGKMSYPIEWSDAAHYDLVIGKTWCTEPPYYNMRLWVKSDAKYVYFLYRIEYPKSQWDINDGGMINYFWPQWDSVTGWPHSDAAYIGLDGKNYDFYGWSLDNKWFEDVDDGGRNNVIGKGTKSGGFYWFEFRRPLNSGDGHDWSFKPGGTYGWRLDAEGKNDHILVTLWDSSESTAYERYITLTLASPPWCAPWR
jgi:hypothetical protein